MKGKLINMTWEWDKETHDLPNTGWAATSARGWSSYVAGVLHTDRINTVGKCFLCPNSPFTFHYQLALNSPSSFTYQCNKWCYFPTWTGITIGHIVVCHLPYLDTHVPLIVNSIVNSPSAPSHFVHSPSLAFQSLNLIPKTEYPKPWESGQS